MEEAREERAERTAGDPPALRPGRVELPPLTSMADEARLLYDSATGLNQLSDELRAQADVTPTLLSYSRFRDRVDRIFLGGVWPYYAVQATRHRRRVLETVRWSEARRVYEDWVESYTGEHGLFERSDVRGCGEDRTTMFVIPGPRTREEEAQEAAAAVAEAEITAAAGAAWLPYEAPWPAPNGPSPPAASGRTAPDRTAPDRERFAAAPAPWSSVPPTGPAGLDVIPFRAFELYLADLLKRDGFQIVKAGGHANDRAADVIAVSPSARRYVIQAKHFTHGRGSVGAPAVYQVNGTAWSVHRADVAVVVTNGRFTRDAERFALDQGIHLVARAGLADWASGARSLSGLVGED